MILYNYETDFQLTNENSISNWISQVIDSHAKTLGELNYIFCDDAYLIKLNREFLNHDTLTDIISFDYTMGNLISGDVFISVERVLDNAADLNISFEEELHRVIIHGVLHYIGFKDKTSNEKSTMRAQENTALELLNI